jgi:hypothetical protein
MYTNTIAAAMPPTIINSNNSPNIERKIMLPPMLGAAAVGSAVGAVRAESAAAMWVVAGWAAVAFAGR